MLQVGFDNRVNHLKVLAIVQVGTKRIHEQIRAAKEENKLVDCTKGRTARSVVCLEGGILVLSAVGPDRLASRWNGELLRRTREDVAILEDDLKVGGWR